MQPALKIATAHNKISRLTMGCSCLVNRFGVLESEKGLYSRLEANSFCRREAGNKAGSSSIVSTPKEG